MVISGLAHIGVFVKDLDVSKAFYCGKLDFKVIEETFLDTDGGRIRIAFIQQGDCVLELVQFPAYKKKDDGFVDHIALKVKDIEKVAGELRTMGITFETPVAEHAPHMFLKGCKWYMFRGPDGEHLEISEIL